MSYLSPPFVENVATQGTNPQIGSLSVAPTYRRVQTSLPSYAQPYNLPIKPMPWRPPCQAYEQAPWGSMYHTETGVYGMCSGGASPGPNGYDFICPKGKLCISQSSPLVGVRPQDICCGRRTGPGINGFSKYNGYSSGPFPGADGTGELSPVKFWKPAQWVAMANDHPMYVNLS